MVLLELVVKFKFMFQVKVFVKFWVLVMIGLFIIIVGDFRGKEDLFIEGKVDGIIQVDQYLVMIGMFGQVNVSVYGKVVMVEGMVEGDFFGSDEIVICKSGKV